MYGIASQAGFKKPSPDPKRICDISTSVHNAIFTMADEKMKSWKLMEVKVQLGKIVKSLPDLGPQLITFRGKPTAVIITLEEYEEKFGKILESVENHS